MPGLAALVAGQVMTLGWVINPWNDMACGEPRDAERHQADRFSPKDRIHDGRITDERIDDQECHRPPQSHQANRVNPLPIFGFHVLRAAALVAGAKKEDDAKESQYQIQDRRGDVMHVLDDFIMSAAIAGKHGDQDGGDGGHFAQVHFQVDLPVISDQERTDRVQAADEDRA